MFKITPPNELILKLKEEYYKLTGVWLNPSDLESFLIDLMVYNYTQIEGSMNYYRKQNFLKYASGEFLDLLGEWLGVERIKPQPAKTILRFFFETPHPQIIVDESVLVVAKDGKTFFKPLKTTIVPENVEFFDIEYIAQNPGIGGNGFIAGEINTIVKPLPYIKECKNITVSVGGTDMENDEHLRERIRLAPWRFNTAGSRKGYIYWALSADSSVIDVNVFSTQPGVVDVVVLTEQLPVSSEIIEKVYKTLSADDVRPLTDMIRVSPAQPVHYEIDISLKLLDEYIPLSTQILDEAEKRLSEFISYTSSKIATPVNPDLIIYKLMDIKGIFRVDINKPEYIEVDRDKVAVGTIKKLVVLPS